MSELEKIIAVNQLAKELMTEYGLIAEGWTFDLDRGKQRIGCCHFRTKKITYSIHYLVQTDIEDIEDTIRHEIAHALAGFEAAHGREWRRIAMQVGARPERCNDIAKATIKPNFIIECSNCHKRWKRLRLRKSLHGQMSSCCHAPLKFYKVVKDE